ncbi:MAG: di-trans,poly-cis-decaprenylcistransferase, partial [Clostridia bacterium]|nr:di-trans,poly-cis-decaprenylcistransferase [Clostridia bacterium]
MKNPVQWFRYIRFRKRYFKEKNADDFQRLPDHVAIIMDGNGRWAKKHRLSVSKGHRQGTEALRSIIRHTDDLGIHALSLYAFSTENWSRPREEVDALMQLILDFFASEIDELNAKNVCIRILGDKDGLPDKQRQALQAAEERTRLNTGLHLNIAINYGGRAELVRAARLLAEEVEQGHIRSSMISEKMFAEHLYTKGLPDVDLLIRT